MNLTPEQEQEVAARLGQGETGRSIALSLGVSPQRVSEVRKRIPNSAPTPTPPARDAVPETEDESDAGKLRSALSQMLPVRERARLMVALVKDKEVPAATRARLLERIDSLCGIHEAPPERESTKPLFEIEGLPADLSFTKPTPPQA